MKISKAHQLIFFVILIQTFLFSCVQDENRASSKSDRPNVILIMTDDQGIGDFGFNGNPYVKTANLDKLASESLNLTNFYVSPVCAPTRASLMTGRYSERTGVYDTYNGGAIMSQEEVTIAEILRDSGYKTGIFGKWHLGDNYPYRPIDQGFDEALVHRGGGIGQPGDYANYFAGDSSYFNPVLFRNGKPTETSGYCSDVFSNAAMDFIKGHNSSGEDKPFFVYLSYNAPHTPLQLPQEYYDMYKDIEFDVNAFAMEDEAVKNMSERDIEAAKRVYGMVTNIDDNIGKLMDVLKNEDLEQNTIVVFLTDNGPQQVRYKLGLRKRKSSVYSGGVRVPCLIRYPQKFQEKRDMNTRLAHIDLLPSILDLCGINQPEHMIDGLSLINENENAINAFSERTLFFEWGRGFPVKYRNFAAISGDYKLVGNTGANSDINDFELYHLASDPFEKTNRIEEEVETASGLKRSMDSWYEEIIDEKNNNSVLPANIGSDFENPAVLNRNDAKGSPPPWGRGSVLGYWDVKILETGNYDVKIQFIDTISEEGNLHLKLYPQYLVQNNSAKSDALSFKNIALQQGDYKLEAYYQTRKRQFIFPLYVSIQKLD